MQTESRTQTLQLAPRSVLRYVAGVLAVGIPILAIPVVFGGEDGIFIPILVYVVLLGGAIMTARRTGAGGVRRLFSGALHWRIGWRNWAIVTGAIPVATIAVAAVTGTYVSPQRVANPPRLRPIQPPHGIPVLLAGRGA